jgi:hypothetical protein
MQFFNNVELSGIKKIVINRKQYFERGNSKIKNPNDWAQMAPDGGLIRMVGDHEMIRRVKSYLRGGKIITHRIVISGDTINIIKRAKDDPVIVNHKAMQRLARDLLAGTAGTITDEPFIVVDTSKIRVLNAYDGSTLR